MLGFLTGCGAGLGAESGSGLRGGLIDGVRGWDACCDAGEVEVVNGPGLGRDSTGDAEGCLGTGELLAEEDFARADVGLGGDFRIACSLEPFTLNLRSFRGRCPSKLVELEDLSGR